MDRTELVLGVAGHRDLTPESWEYARKEVSDFLLQLRKLLPDTPIRLVSGMADGADRLVADEALSQGLSVDAVMPMPMDLYRSDFSAESLAELEIFVARPEVRKIELPLPDGVMTEEAAQPGTARDDAYGRLSEELCRRCHLLIVLWDGDNTDLKGGTSDTVKRFLFRSSGGNGDHSFLEESPADALHDGYAYWVPVGRESRNGERVRETTCFVAGILGSRFLIKQEQMPDELRREMHDLNEYHKTFMDLRDRDILKSEWGLFDTIGDAKIDEKMSELAPIELEYRKADAMAVHFQRLSDRLFMIYSVLAGLMGFAFLVYAKVYASAFFILIYLGVFILGYFSFRWAHKRHWFAKHLMYRLVAEALRAKFYLALVGHHGALGAAELTRATQVSQFAGFNWIVHAFRAAEPALPARPTPADEDAEWLGLARKCWIEDQSRYFANKTHSFHHTHHRIERIKSILLIGLFLSGVLLLFFKSHMVAATIVGDFSVKTALLFLMGLLPLWLGIWEIYVNKMATKELAWQYSNQARLFARTELKLASASDDDGRRQVLSELAQDSLSETYMWIVHRYHREHEPPSAG